LHGSDTTATGARQVWTGRDSQSLTHMGTAALAKALGADPATADNIGLAVDIAVPLAMSAVVGAARVAAVRAGRISLIEHEAEAGSRIGGHTLEKHIGRTEAQLRERLAREPIIRTASTFSNLQMAETAISQVLRANAAKISNWAQIPGSKPLDLVQEIGTVVGYGVVRATGQVVKMTKVRVVLKLETFRGQPYYILTSYLLP
jgi:Bacterial CdiA-CT RNAse A domain